jgi:hypothetical protein
MSEQLSLFHNRSLDPTSKVKEAMRRAIKQSELSREEVVHRMNELAKIEGIKTGGRTQGISLNHFEKWLSQSADHLIPWKLLSIFCTVVKSIDPVRPLLGAAEAFVVTRDEWKLFEWAKTEKEKRSIRKKQKRLEEEMGL